MGKLDKKQLTDRYRQIKTQLAKGGLSEDKRIALMKELEKILRELFR